MGNAKATERLGEIESLRAESFGQVMVFPQFTDPLVFLPKEIAGRFGAISVVSRTRGEKPRKWPEAGGPFPGRRPDNGFATVWRKFCFAPPPPRKGSTFDGAGP